MLPPELASLITQIEDCEQDAERLVADLDDESVNRPPPSGGWSIAQCLEHLTLMNEFYLRGWQDAITDAARAQRGPFRGLHPTYFGRSFAKWMEPPARMKSKTIAAADPGSHFTRDAIVSRYKTSHDVYRGLVRSAEAVDVNRIVRPNAILKQVNMRLATVLLIVPAHDRRHLWQAANVKRAIRGA